MNDTTPNLVLRRDLVPGNARHLPSVCVIDYGHHFALATIGADETIARLDALRVARTWVRPGKVYGLQIRAIDCVFVQQNWRVDLTTHPKVVGTFAPSGTCADYGPL